MGKRKLFDDPAFEKIEILTYLANTLSLNQLLKLEELTRTNRLNKMLNEPQNNGERLNNSTGGVEHPVEHFKSTRIRY